jgi:hypothetical protein
MMLSEHKCQLMALTWAFLDSRPAGDQAGVIRALSSHVKIAERAQNAWAEYRLNYERIAGSILHEGL